MRRLIDRPIRSQDAQDLLEGKVTAAELEARDKAKAKTAPNYIRRPLIRRPLTTTPTTKPLSLAEQRARSRWQRPLPAILAEAMAVNCGLRDRMSRSVKGPDWNHHEL